MDKIVTLPRLTRFLDNLKTRTFVVQETGKGLSANDFTDAYKQKLDNLGNPLTLKGQVGTVGELPAQNNKPGDVYYVGDPAGSQFDLHLWTGTAWEKIASVNTNIINYTALPDKPQIQGVTLEGNKTAQDLGLALDNNVVKLTGNQTAQGTKSFTKLETTNTMDIKGDNVIGIDFKTVAGNRRVFIGHGQSANKQNFHFMNSNANGLFDFDKIIQYATPQIRPTQDQHLTPKKYVDDAIANAGGQTVQQVEEKIRQLAVLLTDDQTVAGIKTFASAPKSTAIAVADDELTTIAYLKANYTEATDADIDALQ